MSAQVNGSSPIMLDWSRLLGFDQVRRPQLGSEPMMRQILLARVGALKVGEKRR